VRKIIFAMRQPFFDRLIAKVIVHACMAYCNVYLVIVILIRARPSRYGPAVVRIPLTRRMLINNDSQLSLSQAVKLNGRVFLRAFIVLLICCVNLLCMCSVFVLKFLVILKSVNLSANSRFDKSRCPSPRA